MATTNGEKQSGKLKSSFVLNEVEVCNLAAAVCFLFFVFLLSNNCFDCISKIINENCALSNVGIYS